MQIAEVLRGANYHCLLAKYGKINQLTFNGSTVLLYETEDQKQIIHSLYAHTLRNQQVEFVGE